MGDDILEGEPFNREILILVGIGSDNHAHCYMEVYVINLFTEAIVDNGHHWKRTESNSKRRKARIEKGR